MFIRSQFPIFQHHPNLAYLDNAATTQKPQSVIAGIQRFYEAENANIHRGIYDLAAQTTVKYEAVRQKIANFIHAPSPKNIVYTSGTTDAINLVAFGFLAAKLKAGDEVLITAMEHHANLIPWQMVCKDKGATLKIIPITETGELDLAVFRQLVSSKTKLLAVVHISNTLGTINPIEQLIITAKKYDIPVLIDAAQSITYHPINVQQLDCDFLVFSGHKAFGPTGIGVLYGKKEHLQIMTPIRFGGDMIKTVSYDTATFADAPQRFEAGTTNIAGVIGLGYAIDFIQQLDRHQGLKHIHQLTQYAYDQLANIPKLRFIGQAKQRSGILSFVLENAHPHDVATFLGEAQIAVRAGHHCTQPLMHHYGIPGTVRVSFSIYNTEKEVDRLVRTVREVVEFFERI